MVDIKTFNVIYYLEAKSHKIRKYFKWKSKKIKAIIKDTTNKKHFNIFDDMDDYFSKIRKFGDKRDIQIHLTLIKNEDSWKKLIQ